jgi:hypothetical protein
MKSQFAPRDRRNASSNGSSGPQPAALSPECFCWRSSPVRSFVPCPKSWLWPERVAASILGTDEETAGVRLIKIASPERRRDIVAAYRTFSDNRAAIGKCERNGAKPTGMIQCVIEIRNPNSM